MFSTITTLAKLALCTVFTLGGIALLIITIGAIFDRGYDFIPCTIFLIGSIGMTIQGIQGFKEVKNEKKSSTLTIYYAK